MTRLRVTVINLSILALAKLLVYATRADAVTLDEVINQLPRSSFPELNAPDACAVKSRIIGGQETTDFPYVVALYGADGTHKCTATLVAQGVLLTAAHCFKLTPGQMPTSTSRMELFVELSPGVRVKIDRVLIHPQFGFAISDLAIASFKSPSIHPVAVLASTRPPVGSPVKMVGFGGSGLSQNGFDNGEGRGEKRVGDNMISHLDEDGRIVLNSGMIETLSPEERRNRAAASGGDSGGPLFFGSPPQMIGVVQGGTLARERYSNYIDISLLNNFQFITNGIRTLSKAK
jgi:hypothetical protein